MFLDLGSNLGVYSLLVAQTRHSAGDLRLAFILSVNVNCKFVNLLHICPLKGWYAIKYDGFGEGMVPDLKVLTKHKNYIRATTGLDELLLLMPQGTTLHISGFHHHLHYYLRNVSHTVITDNYICPSPSVTAWRTTIFPRTWSPWSTMPSGTDKHIYEHKLTWKLYIETESNNYSPSDVSETLYPVPNLADDPLTNPGSWQFVGKNDVSDLLDSHNLCTRLIVISNTVLLTHKMKTQLILNDWTHIKDKLLQIGKREILGPPTSSITMKTLLHAIPPTTLIVKMDIQVPGHALIARNVKFPTRNHTVPGACVDFVSLKGLECRALQSLGQFPASHPMPYIFMEWKELVISARRSFDDYASKAFFLNLRSSPGWKKFLCVSDIK